MAPDPIDDETLAALGEGRLIPDEARRAAEAMRPEDRAAVRDLFDVDVGELLAGVPDDGRRK